MMNDDHLEPIVETIIKMEICKFVILLLKVDPSLRNSNDVCIIKSN